MKVGPGQADGFVRKPPAGVRAVLIYGPDLGLVQERGKALLAAVSGDPDDPFRVVELTGQEVLADGARLADELGSLPFTGGRRVVRLRGAGDGLAERIEAALDNPDLPGFLIVEAGELAGRSSLRALFEGPGDLAALACYRDDEAGLAGLARGMLKEAGVEIEKDALAFLASHLGGDRQQSRSEIEKLLLYKTAGESTGPITLDEVQASIGDSAEITAEDLAFAVGAGDVAAVDRAYRKALEEGESTIRLIRFVSSHFQRLHLVAGLLSEGQPYDAASRRLRPQVFWKRKDAFAGQVRAWGRERLAQAVGSLLELELDCKSTGAPQEELTGRRLLQMAANAPSGRRR